jgi:hypothetical protein
MFNNQSFKAKNNLWFLNSAMFNHPKKFNLKLSNQQHKMFLSKLNLKHNLNNKSQICNNPHITEVNNHQPNLAKMFCNLTNNLKLYNIKDKTKFIKATTSKDNTNLILFNITKELYNNNLKCNNLKLYKDLLLELFSNLSNNNSLNKSQELFNNNKLVRMLSNKLLNNQ